MERRKAILAGAKALGVLLVLALLYVVLRRIGFRNILEAMGRASLASIRAAVLLQLAVFVLWSFCWQQLMPRAERKSIAALFPIYMAGVFGNVMTPGARVGGEPIRAYYMSRAFGGEKSAYLGTMLAAKLGNMAVFLSLLLTSAVFVLVYVPLGLVSKLLLEGVVLLVAGAVVSGFLLRRQIGVDSRLLRKVLLAVYDSRLLRFVRKWFPTYQHFEDYAILKLGNVFNPIGRAAKSPKSLTRTLVISAGSWALIFTAHYVLFRGLGIDIGPLKVIIIVTIATFCGDVSVSPGGAGFMEASMIGLCAAFGVEYRAAAAVTLISRGIFYAYGIGVGGMCLGGLVCLYGRRR